MSEKLLANGSVVTDPATFRVTITLPHDLKKFIETRANQNKYRSLRGKNVSAYLRDLAYADQTRFTRVKKGARHGRG